MHQLKKFKYRNALQSAFIIVVLLIVSSTFSGYAARPMGEIREIDEFETSEIPPDALDLDFSNKRTGPVHPKLDSVLAKVAKAAEESNLKAIKTANSQLLKTNGQKVQVQITTHSQGIDTVIEGIIQSGGEVTGTGLDDTLIQAWLPATSLELVATLDDVYYIRRPAEAITLETDTSSEGLAVINAPAWHTAGHQGVGVKVGIIDSGFLGYNSLLGSELPATVTVKNFVDGETDPEVDGTSKHGTACVEIVHDIAPEASLFLAKTSTNLDLEEAVNWLKNTQDVDIISTSLGWYNLTPGDGTGEFADLVNQARTSNILWATAAGNDREAHWGGPYFDPEPNNVHNFATGQEINYFGPGDGTGYLIPAGYTISAFVRWDDWTNVDQDYDLYLLRFNGSSWDTMGSSENPQDGGPGQSPTEAVFAITSGGSAVYGLAISRYNSDRNVNFEMFAPKVASLDKVVHSRSLANLADSPEAMTVAALDVTSPYPQEPYSSQGPTNGPGGAETGGITKPDISGFANVSTSSYGTGEDKFNGTSAATPHVAGAAALVLGANPTYTPAQIQAFLEGRAIDKGSPGKDNQFGFGRLYLGEPIDASRIYLPFVLKN